MGRPKKEISRETFEKLCGLQCTKLEICAFLEVSDKTLDKWVKRTYRKSFSEVYKEKKGIGKISLRRTQWKLAEKSASMAIWLGKQYLDQRESTVLGGSDQETADDPITIALKEEIEDAAER